MKKIIAVTLFAVAFGLVGCASQQHTDKSRSYTSTEQKAKCKGKKHRSGKLGVEQTTEDTAK